jgi:hypothetical protein
MRHHHERPRSRHLCEPQLLQRRRRLRRPDSSGWRVHAECPVLERHVQRWILLLFGDLQWHVSSMCDRYWRVPYDYECPGPRHLRERQLLQWRWVVHPSDSCGWCVRIQRRVCVGHVQRRLLLLKRDVQRRVHRVRAKHRRVQHSVEWSRRGLVQWYELLQCVRRVRRPSRCGWRMHCECPVHQRLVR